jgi:carboxyl-terminal processing protease
MRPARKTLSLLLFPLLWMMLSSISTAQEVGKTPGDIVIEAVIKAIEERYLHAHGNPLWNIARQKLMSGTYKTADSAFQAVRTQLATLEDSELNLLTPAEIGATQSEALGEKIGLGLPDFAIDIELATGEVRVVTPIVGSPAMNAKIQPADVITTINGKSVRDLSHEQVMDALRAQPTTRLQIHRGEQTIEATLEASTQKLQPLESARKLVKGAKVGYIRLTQFTPDLAPLVRQAIMNLEKAGVDIFVLDLRNNPGGYLNVARDVAGMFTTGTLGFENRSNGKKTPLTSAGEPLTKKPLAVLINGGTASAAEFLSSALQGTNRASLVGVHTYGRGQAQIFTPLSGGYGIQIPSVQLLTTRGQTYKGSGISPDVEVEQAWIPEKELGTLQDRQFVRAVAEIAKKK